MAPVMQKLVCFSVDTDVARSGDLYGHKEEHGLCEEHDDATYRRGLDQ